MPAYNYKARFAPDVESGKKRQTLRRPRKRPTRPGEHLKHYTGMRTKACRLLTEATCLSVEPVLVDVREIPQLWPRAHIEVSGKVLTHRESLAMAEADGFDCVSDFVDFFKDQYGLPVELELIKW